MNIAWLRDVDEVLGTHRVSHAGILAAVRLGINNAQHEGLNRRVRLVVNRAYGFHSADADLLSSCQPFADQPRASP
jgi:transposase